MKDGGTGDAKLNLIEKITLQSNNLTSIFIFYKYVKIEAEFESSCNFYKQNDY
jgi:hypothetical protein